MTDELVIRAMTERSIRTVREDHPEMAQKIERAIETGDAFLLSQIAAQLYDAADLSKLYQVKNHPELIRRFHGNTLVSRTKIPKHQTFTAAAVFLSTYLITLGVVQREQAEPIGAEA